MISGRTSIAVLATLLATFLCAPACAPGSGDSDPAEDSAARTLPYPLEKPDFTFTDVNGEAYHFRNETDGYVTLLFFGYTHCPDICPVQMANVGAVLRDLPAESARRIKVVFVTTDPERDTPERMREWLGAIHPAIVGLRGPLKAVHAAEQSLLLPHSVVEAPHGTSTNEAPADYLVGHATPVVVFSADGWARSMYPAGTRQQDWRRDLPRLVAEPADRPEGS